ncbi:MAG: tripartite tricarboxylate transporter substrate binding protein [Synergistaceae bacterium]|jgi:putative tricarboxylic transport membrane protein|nr:tripartite tricarboxylate transporter substrate binding protein [Synergistaceae bacterium]
MQVNRRTEKTAFFLIILLVVSLCAVIFEVSPANAAFPEKPITIINSATAGSPTDVLARQIANCAEQFLGQPMVVVNKPGGGGGAAFAALLMEPADGYTVASINASQITALQTQLKKDFSYDDFDFVCSTQLDPYAVAVLADGPFKTLQDIADYAKKEGTVMVGGQGTGTGHHLMILRFAQLGGFDVTWLPYQGGADSVTNLLGGHVQVIATAPATVSQYVEAGKIRILAVSGEKRLEFFPDAPTFKESGYDIVMTIYRGFIAKKGISADVRAKLSSSIQKAMEVPAFQEFVRKSNQIITYMDSEEFSAYAKKDFEQMAQMAELQK